MLVTPFVPLVRDQNRYRTSGPVVDWLLQFIVSSSPQTAESAASAAAPLESASRLGPHGLVPRALLFLLLLTGLGLYGGELWKICCNPYRDRIIDYYQEWSSARSWWVGEPLYQLTNQTVLRDFPEADRNSTQLLGYNVHPPTSILISLPLGALPHFDSLIVWNVLGLIGLLGCWISLARHPTARWSWGTALLVAVILLWGKPFWQQFRQGQLNPILLVCLLLGWRAYERGRLVRAGFWIGGAAAIKLFPAFVGVYFLFRRDWKMLASCIVWGLLITALTVGVLGVETYRDYFEQVMPDALAWRSARTNASLPSLFCKLFDPGPRGGNYQPLLQSPLVARTCIALAWAGTLWLLWDVSRRMKTNQTGYYAFNVTLIAMLLLSPVTWEHSFLLLVGPLTVIYRQIRQRELWRWWFWLSLALLNAPVYALIEQYLNAAEAGAGMTPLQVMGIPSLYCYGLASLLVLGWVGSRTFTEPAPAPQTA